MGSDVTETAGDWIGIAELAEEIAVPIRTIYNWRSKGYGPRGATFGKHVRFRRADVERWIEAQYDPRHAA